MTSSGDKDAKMAVNGPLFFLIQEQAKTTVSIQALQSRMAVLENLQERLMQAIDDVNKYLTPSNNVKHHTSFSKPLAQTNLSKCCSVDKKLRFADLGVSDCKQSDCSEAKTKGESSNKDSGIGASGDSFGNSSNKDQEDDDDELLQLLDLIDQKSVSLLKQVESTCQPSTERGPEMEGAPNAMLDDLLFEKVDAQRQLSEVKAERDELRRRLAQLELATEAVTKEKLKIQHQLDLTIEENQIIQERMQRSDEALAKSESLGFMEDIEKANLKRKYLHFSEKSRLRVSTILKENSVLELKKQLLTYVMENDVLRAKLQQDGSNRLSSWMKVEKRLKTQLKEALDSNQSLQETIRTRNLEIASLKDRIRKLEEGCESETGVKNFGMDSNDDWRAPGTQNVYNKRSNLNAISPYTAVEYGDFSKTQSLPAMLLLDTKLKEQESAKQNYGPVYDTASFTDVPLNQSIESDRPDQYSSHFSDNKELVDLSLPSEQNYSTTSTLVQTRYMPQTAMQSGLSTPNLNGRCSRATVQHWGYNSRNTSTSNMNGNIAGAKLVNGHLCWKGTERLGIVNGHQDLSSICTEFDPLSDESQSCENFVDSLNLSIPLKPTQVAISQLSSIGDSLHSASLDLGCSSTPEQRDRRKMHIARSVDGIRELFVDSSYCKRPPSLQYGQSNVAPMMRLGKSNRNVSVNLMNCMHESADYSLL